MIDTEKIVTGLNYKGVPLPMKGGTTNWGEIGGDITDQEDLQEIILDFDERVTNLEEHPSEDGATFIPSVDANGNISWTNDKSLPNPTTRNIKGAKGDKGDKGDTGDDGHSPVITATKSGTTTSIKVDGVAIASILDGAKGATGDKGDKGDAFKYSDFTTEQLASLKGEKGDKGDKGDSIQGDKGDKGDKGDPFVYSDFTPEQLAALKGSKGDKGDKGDTGSSGHTPVRGTDYWTSSDKQSIVNEVLAALPVYAGW